MLGAGGGGGGDDAGGMPQLPKDGDVPSRDEMLQTIESLQKAQKAQGMANDLKSKAMAMTSSKQREKLITEAFDKEMEANGHSKMAKRMQSGSWQGLGFGGGIGAATGLGLGSGLGVLLGAITAVPTAGIGALVGTGVGAIHGPFVKLGGKGGKVEEVPFEDADPGRVVDALEEQRKAQSEQGSAAGGSGSGEEKPRRKPKKLEIRSKKNTESGQQGDTESDNGANGEAAVQTGVSEESQPPRRKPKKLEIRSGKGGNAPAAKT